jgi:hypothetical protein
MDHDLLHPKGVDEVGLEQSLKLVEPELRRAITSKGSLREIKHDVMRAQKEHGIIDQEYNPGKMQEPTIQINRLNQRKEKNVEKSPWRARRQDYL